MISRVNPDWSFGAKLSSDELDDIEDNITYALDKRVGETDTLESVVTLGATGRIIQAAVTAPDSNTTYQIDAGVLTVRVPALTAERSYTLSNTNAVAGDEITFAFDPSALGLFDALIKDNGGATLATLGPSTAAHWGTFKFVSGAWTTLRLGGSPRRLDLAPALSFPVAATAALATHAKYEPVKRRWFACGTAGTDRLISTLDPYVWPASTEITGGDVLTETVWDFAFNDVGDMIALGKDFDAAVWQRSEAGVWSTPGGGVLNEDDVSAPGIVYETTAGLWCAVGRNVSTTSIIVRTSSDGSSWTSRTPPTGMPANTTAVTVAAANGVIVMRCQSGTNLYTSRSTDGGVTWSAAATTALGFTPFIGAGGTREPYPVWTGTEWLVHASNISSNATKVYASDDGASWTLRCSLAATGVLYFASMAELDFLCGTTGANELVFSTNGGVTWFYGPRKLASSITSMAASPNQFLFVAGGSVYPSNAMGRGSSAA